MSRCPCSNISPPLLGRYTFSGVPHATVKHDAKCHWWFWDHIIFPRGGKKANLGIKQVQHAKIIQQVLAEFWGQLHHWGSCCGALHLLFSRNSPVSSTSSTPLILCIKSTELNHRTGLENFTQVLWNVWQWNKLYFNLTIYGWLLLSAQNITVLQSKNNFDVSVYNWSFSKSLHLHAAPRFI